MPDMIRIKLDLTKVMDEYLFNSEKTGAQYLDATLIPSKDSKYGDSHFIVQDVGKAAREAGKKGPIIGNAKLIERKSQGSPAPARNPAPAPQATNDSEDIPF